MDKREQIKKAIENKDDGCLFLSKRKVKQKLI